MKKIATHDSATSEKPINFLSWLTIPFARTQSKTLQEQIDYGVRMFDFRAKLYNGVYHNGHGPYTCKRTLEDMLRQINSIGEQTYLTLTYEGKLETQEKIDAFINQVNVWKKMFPNIMFGGVAVKYTDNDLKVDWEYLTGFPSSFPKSVSKFIALNGKSWQTYIPIPWLWKKFYFNKPEFNDECFTYVDFL